MNISIDSYNERDREALRGRRYRGILISKSMQKESTGIQREIERSLRRLKTDSPDMLLKVCEGVFPCIGIEKGEEMIQNISILTVS